MKYAVLKIVNGNFLIDSEHGEDKDAAIIRWHTVSAALRNDAETKTATIKVIDEQGDLVDGYKEYISKVEDA